MRKTIFLAVSYSQRFTAMTRSMAKKTSTVPSPLRRGTRAKRTPSTWAPKRLVTWRTSSLSPGSEGSARRTARSMAASAAAWVSPRATSASPSLSSAKRSASRAAFSNTVAISSGACESGTAGVGFLPPIMYVSRIWMSFGMTKTASASAPRRIFFLKLRQSWPPPPDLSAATSRSAKTDRASSSPGRSGARLQSCTATCKKFRPGASAMLPTCFEPWKSRDPNRIGIISASSMPCASAPHRIEK